MGLSKTLFNPAKTFIGKLKERRRFFAVFLIIIMILGGAIFAYNLAYAQKVFPRISVAGYDLSGRTKEEALNFLNQKVEAIKNQRLVFEIGNNQYIISLPEIAAEEELISFNLPNTINEIYAVGHGEKVWQNLWEQIITLIAGREVNPDVRIDNNLLDGKLKEKLGPLEGPAQNAGFIVEENRISGVSEEKAGTELNYAVALAVIKKSVSNLEIVPIINLTHSPTRPKITADEAVEYIEPANELIELAPLKLVYGGDEWEITKGDLANWLTLKTHSEEIGLGIKQTIALEFLAEIAEKINRQPVNAVFEYQNGWAKEFKPHEDGLELDMDNTILNIEQELIKNKKSQIELVVKNTPPDITIGEINNFNIKELVGFGESDFAGSPKNRIHNIRVGAAKLQGILIAPGEEFSLVKTLGKVDASTGYLPELVIKGDRTVPEYGGGLCQIGTTAFRAAMGAGLPITERKNHSFRVSYYEPAGTDATIYDPKPDFKFINDTGNYLIFNTKIEGTKLRFELWGVKDGRSAERTDPVIYNIVSPGPTKYIESEELKLGEEKCVEKPHNGADAYFYYTVTYFDGRVAEKRFDSHYIPWPKICLVGKEPASDEEIEDGGEENQVEENNNEPEKIIE